MIRLFPTILMFLLLSFCKEKEGSKHEKKENKNIALVSLPALEKPEGFSFQVDDVQIADYLLSTDSAKKV